MRMSRSRRQKLIQKKERLKSLVKLSIGSVILLRATNVAASSFNTFYEVSDSIAAMVNERDKISNYQALQAEVKAAKSELQQAEANLIAARQDKSTADKYLAEAKVNLIAAQKHLAEVTGQLETAKIESAERTQEAIASQQAVADFWPQIYAKESEIAEARQEEAAVNADYASLVSANKAQQEDLARRIEEAWQSVDYRNNCLHDVQAMIADFKAQQAASEGDFYANQESYNERLQAIADNIDTQESELDDLNEQLSYLEEAREEAENAEADARELVRDLTNELTEAKNDTNEAKADVAQSQAEADEAANNLRIAADDVNSSSDYLNSSEKALADCGNGYGYASGLEYYNWRDSSGRHGHQLYRPLQAYMSEKKWEATIETGWVQSASGYAGGSFSGFTDTALSVTYKNDHKKNTVHYSLSFNLPTGKDNVRQSAMLTDELARFTSFSEGFNYAPAVTVTHYFTERDSLSGKISYQIRGNYHYLADMNNDKVQIGEYSRAELKEDINPGAVFRQDLRLAHIGDERQTAVELTHINASHSIANSYITGIWDETGNRMPSLYLGGAGVGEHYASSRNYDAESWWLKIFNRREFFKDNAYLTYSALNYDSGQVNSAHRYYFGTGLSRNFDKKQAACFIYNYRRTFGDSYDWQSGQRTGDSHRQSLLLGYNYRLSDNNSLNLKLERYIINEKNAPKHNGVNVSLLFNRSF